MRGMTDPQHEPTREDTVYAHLFAFIRQCGFLLAIAAPLLLLGAFIKDEVLEDEVLFVLGALILWGEAIAFELVQRRRRGGDSAPSVIVVLIALNALGATLLWTLSWTLH